MADEPWVMEAWGALLGKEQNQLLNRHEEQNQRAMKPSADFPRTLPILPTLLLWHSPTNRKRASSLQGRREPKTITWV